MEKVSLVLILFMITLLPCGAVSLTDNMIKSNNNTLVFVYHIPDDEPKQQSDDAVDNEPEVITSDDVTADTSLKNDLDKDDVDDNEDVSNSEQSGDEYQLTDMYSDVLYGYAQYSDDNAISLDDIEEEFLKLNIQKPYRISTQSFTDLRTPSSKLYNSYSKYNAPEYSIIPVTSTNYRKIKGFSAGTIFDQSIDYGELEQSSGVFSRYEYKCLALNTAYKKTVNSTNNNYNDNFYLSPEWKLNQYLTLREILSTDITRNLKKSELILSINPFGNKDIDRLRFELGASQTFSNTNELIKNQFKFATSFKL